MELSSLVFGQILFSLVVGFLFGIYANRKWGAPQEYDYEEDFEWKNSDNTNALILYDKRNKVFYPTIRIIKSKKKDKPENYDVSSGAMKKAAWRKGVRETVWKKYLEVKDSYKDVWDFIDKTL